MLRISLFKYQINLSFAGNAHFIFLSVARAFRLNSGKFIKWPARHEYPNVTQQFTFPFAIGMKYQVYFLFFHYTYTYYFDTFVGSIDGTYIRIRQPLHQCRAYTNRKKFCAITLQAVCKPNLEFIDVSTGYPSSMHDSSVYAHSRLSQNLTRLLAGTRYVLLADSAYGLTVRIMKPYRNNGRLSNVSNFVIIFSFQ